MSFDLKIEVLEYIYIIVKKNIFFYYTNEPLIKINNYDYSLIKKYIVFLFYLIFFKIKKVILENILHIFMNNVVLKRSIFLKLFINQYNSKKNI